MSFFFKKRVWIVLMVLLFAYLLVMTQVPSTPRYTLRTTGIAKPVFHKGQVDYFAELEQRINHRLYPAADNGFRDVLAACGPRILEQSAMMDAVPWEHLAVHQYSDRWYQNYWLPVCALLEIDPAPRPKYLDSFCFESYFYLLKQEYEKQRALLPAPPPDMSLPSEPPLSKALPGYLTMDSGRFRESIVKAPLDLSENPEIAKWLAQRDPVLDIFNASVRKPNYVCPRTRPEDGGLWVILLPDVQAQRQFARDLQVRISAKIFQGDIDAAWHDTMSMYLLSRKHYQYEFCAVTQLVGLAIEGMGNESLQMILQHGKPTKEQLEKIAADLDSLPPVKGCFKELEYTSLALYDNLRQQRICNEYVTSGSSPPSVSLPDLKLLEVLPLDQNIAGERLTQLLEQSGLLELAEEKYYPPGSEERKRLDEKMDRLDQFLIDRQKSLVAPDDFRFYMKLLTIQSRSRLAAETVFVESLPAIPPLLTAFDRAVQQFEAIRISVAQELEKLEHER